MSGSETGPSLASVTSTASPAVSPRLAHRLARLSRGGPTVAQAGRPTATMCFAERIACGRALLLRQPALSRSRPSRYVVTEASQRALARRLAERFSSAVCADGPSVDPRFKGGSGITPRRSKKRLAVSAGGSYPGWFGLLQRRSGNRPPWLVQADVDSGMLSDDPPS
jgi:hypothetical protein